MNKTKRIAVIGSTGYTAHELIRLLIRHPYAQLTAVTSESQLGVSLLDYFPDLVQAPRLNFQSVQELEYSQFDLVFLCTPHGESQKIAPQFMNNGVAVIDLSGDYRLRSADSYSIWYKQTHSNPENLLKAVYGLPELNRQQIASAKLVANPGCYPTGALLSLLPLVKAGILHSNKIIIDAKSGVSGAGKKPTSRTHFVEAHENISAYNIGHQHRHIGEIEQILEGASQKKFAVLFTPQLVPINRGIFETIYVETKTSTQAVLSILKETYSHEPFVKVWTNNLPDIHSAIGTNVCHIGAFFEKVTNTLILVTAFDNLIKGASGQAVQNMNIMFGWNETEGLL